MEVPFAPDTETPLQQVAASYGKTPAQLVQDTVSNALERRTEFLAAVDRGIASADRGDLIEYDEAIQRINRLLSAS